MKQRNPQFTLNDLFLIHMVILDSSSESTGIPSEKLEELKNKVAHKLQYKVEKEHQKGKKRGK